MEYRKRIANEAHSKPMTNDAAPVVNKKEVNLATSVDNMDFFGGSGGGVLTREGIANAQKTRSKSIDAMEALSEAVKTCGDLPPDEAADALQSVIGDAYEAGVSVTSPVMKRAAALLTALENARESAEAVKAATDSGLDSKLNALFDGFAPPPDLDLDY